MKVKIESSKLVKPFYEGNPQPPTTTYTPLSVFDKITYDQHEAAIYAFKPPTPPNAIIELGLRKALAVYREWAGRLGRDEDGEPIILLNDEGVRFVEASVDHPQNETVHFQLSPILLSLHPSLEGVVELFQVQVTRFLCGSMVVGFTFHHFVADGCATRNFLVAWGEACRGLDISPLPFHDRKIFFPRNPPKFEFEHRGVVYITKNLEKVFPLIDNSVEDIVVHKVHYSKEFLSKLKFRASSMNGTNKPFSTFESLVAHLWRAITKARGLNGLETTQLRISVDGRYRLNPKVPKQYFGNLVLWAFARAKVSDLLCEPLSYAAKLLHDAVMKVDDNYFRSFIDFANHKVKEEDLIPNAVPDADEPILWPNLEVHSWLSIPCHDFDFGGGGAYFFMPTFSPIEGMIFLLPSSPEDGSIDVFVPLFRENLTTFKQICYSLIAKL